MTDTPKGIVSRILGGALGLLLAALALKWAVCIIESILPALIIMAVVVGAVVGLVLWSRARWGGW